MHRLKGTIAEKPPRFGADNVRMIATVDQKSIRFKHDNILMCSEACPHMVCSQCSTFIRAEDEPHTRWPNKMRLRGCLEAQRRAYFNLTPSSAIREDRNNDELF